jgi:hypothetical protein
MILAYRSLMKTYIRLVNKAKALSGRERITLKPAISSIEKQLEEVARMIAGGLVGGIWPTMDSLRCWG